MLLDGSQARRQGRAAPRRLGHHGPNRASSPRIALAIALGLGLSAATPALLCAQSPVQEAGGGGGSTVSSLPAGHVQVTHESKRYGFHGGRFYLWLPDRRLFRLVDAPVGAAVPHLPRGARVRELRGITYHVFRGVYYKPTRRHGRRVYVVAKVWGSGAD